ncbi:BnaC07g15420D [Brassica napus]|uniref:BnaC07g15420D protein n=1 Tax=Brassica napus TaxID=3708 RepID=A0A078H307_BRANA|nr:BnaC07g15420D [Brassica napus]
MAASRRPNWPLVRRRKSPRDPG